MQGHHPPSFPGDGSTLLFFVFPAADFAVRLNRPALSLLTPFYSKRHSSIKWIPWQQSLRLPVCVFVSRVFFPACLPVDADVLSGTFSET